MALPPRLSGGVSERLNELLRPDAFEHRAVDIQLRETHISWVILAGEYAYKIRKPVNFGFLDFSSLDKRRADCEAEIGLNRRLCPDLYLGIQNVVDRDGQLAIGGHGEPVEPVVQMRRLPEGGMLPELLQRHAADERLMTRIAAQLAEFHARAATGPGVDEHGTLESIRDNWRENFAQTANCAESVLPPARQRAIQAYVDAFLTTHQCLLHQRVADGRIRDGHGDLHAGSVCVVRRRVYLFDCVEFNARIRCGDVAAEVAFLAMDLDHLGRADLAHAFVASYGQHSGDAQLDTLLRFYKCYRAYVRGKVLAFRLADPHLGAPERDELAREARAYFDLALAYACAAPAEPLLVVTMGPPASGKTTLAHDLAGRLGMVHVASDVVRKRLTGLRPTQHASDGFEQGLYTRKMSQRTYAAMRRQAAMWLKSGHSVVLDATYGKPSERAAIRRMARRLGARMYVIVCRADDKILQTRLAARATAKNVVSDARAEMWPALRAAFVEPTEMPEALRVDTSMPREQVLDRVLAHVNPTKSPSGD